MLTKAKVTLLGRTGKPAEMRYTPKGTPVTSFSVAVDQGTGDDKTTKWWDCEAWGKLGEIVANLLAVKGRAVLVEGQLVEEYWKDKNTGEPRSKLKVKVSDFNVLDSKSEAAPEQKLEVRTNHQFEDDEEIIPIA